MKQETSLYLDLVRFSAALVVFLGHAAGKSFSGGFLWQFGAYLQTAVMIFFVLSGFVIGYVANTKEKTLSDYWVARIARLGSIVIAALLLTMLCDFIGLSLDRGFYVNGPWSYPAGSQFLNYFLSLFLVQNIWEMDLNPGINKPFWSLSYELMYYAIFSAAFFLKGKRSVIVVLALCALAGPTILALLPIWLMGYGCYLAFSRYENRLTAHKLLYSALSIACLAALVFGGPWIRRHVDYQIPYIHRVDLVGDYFDAIVFSLHLLFSLSLLAMLKPILLRYASIIKWAASLTFALYLFHRPLIQVFAVVSPFDPASISNRLIVLGGTFLVVATLGAWCEKQKYPIKKFLKTAVLPRIGWIAKFLKPELNQR